MGADGLLQRGSGAMARLSPGFRLGLARPDALELEHLHDLALGGGIFGLAVLRMKPFTRGKRRA